MTINPTNRIASIDLLKGFVMVIMALDHTRDYFHASAYLYSPTDPTQTTWAIYLTRYITHFCAPAFSFLAGISAYMVGRRKTPAELSGFLAKRGLWLMFIELTVVDFAWYFNVHFNNFDLAVIWSLGVSMLVLAALIHLPRKAILIFSCILIFGHNALDTVHFPGNILWSILHEEGSYNFSEGFTIYVDYPIIPWIAVMSLGYWFGSFYNKAYTPEKRKNLFNIIGISSLLLFFLLRKINIYGDLHPWTMYNTTTKSMMSFLNPTKYPPSLSYLLMTLGMVFLFLANSENFKGKIVAFFSTFGRVPFFYYILHLYLIHFIALLASELTGYGWQTMLLPDWVNVIPGLKGFGFPLWVVYIVWIFIIAIAYPLCKRFDKYKMNHKETWWLSYL